MFRLLSANQNPQFLGFITAAVNLYYPDYTVGTRRIGIFLDYTITTRIAVPQFISFSLHRALSRSYIYERGRKHKKKGHGAIDLVLRDGDGDGRGGVRARVVVVGAALVEVERVAQRVVPELPRGRAPPPPPGPSAPPPKQQHTVVRSLCPSFDGDDGDADASIDLASTGLMGIPPLSLSIGRLAPPWESARADGCCLLHSQYKQGSTNIDYLFYIGFISSVTLICSAAIFCYNKICNKNSQTFQFRHILKLLHAHQPYFA